MKKQNPQAKKTILKISIEKLFPFPLQKGKGKNKKPK